MLTRSSSNSGKWGSAQCSDQSPRWDFLLRFLYKIYVCTYVIPICTKFLSLFYLLTISNRRVCTVCEFYTKKTIFSLRGLCDDSRHDRTFVLQRDGLNKPFFKGLSTSIIEWVRMIWNCITYLCSTKILSFFRCQKSNHGTWLISDIKTVKLSSMTSPKLSTQLDAKNGISMNENVIGMIKMCG